MPGLSDAEILSALPIETQKKIDSAFEALSQSLPSDKERLILYRVVTALKLNPTDTHFSIMAAMHYYLQLYQVIPDKIVNAGGKVIAAGREVDAVLRKATQETLTEHTKALEAQAELFAQKTRADLIAVFGEVAHKIAQDSFAYERQKSFVQAVVAISVFGAMVFAAGMAQGAYPLNTLVALSLALGIGLMSGGGLSYFLLHSPTSEQWNSQQFLVASISIHLPHNLMLACRDVLVEGCSVVEAAGKRQVDPNQLLRGINQFDQIRRRHG